MFKYLSFALLAATSAQALWLSTADETYSSNSGGGIFGSPYCQVGKGDTQAESYGAATNTVDGTLIFAGGGCDQLPYRHTNQLGGFWDGYGTINYEDDNWHWYCSTGSGSSGSCDAGNGAPKKRRSMQEVQFKA